MNGHSYGHPADSRPGGGSGVTTAGGGAQHGPLTASSIWKSLRKKYVLLCCLCGCLCLALGILYLVIYFVVGRYTSSLHYFQTMPLYIPAIVVSFLSCYYSCMKSRSLYSLGAHFWDEINCKLYKALKETTAPTTLMPKLEHKQSDMLCSQSHITSNQLVIIIWVDDAIFENNF